MRPLGCMKSSMLLHLALCFCHAAMPERAVNCLCGNVSKPMSSTSKGSFFVLCLTCTWLAHCVQVDTFNMSSCFYDPLLVLTTSVHRLVSALQVVHPHHPEAAKPGRRAAACVSDRY